MREEFEGDRHRARAARSPHEEHLQAMKILWSEDPASFEGSFTSFDDVVLATTPRTEGGPPTGSEATAGSGAAAGASVWVPAGTASRSSHEEIPGAARTPGGARPGRWAATPTSSRLSVARGLMPPGREDESFIPDRRMLGGWADADRG